MKFKSTQTILSIYFCIFFLAFNICTPLPTILAQEDSFNYWIYASKNYIELVTANLNGSDSIPIWDTTDNDTQILGIRSSENGRILLLTLQNHKEKSLCTYFRESQTSYVLANFPINTSVPYGDISKDGSWVVFTGTQNNQTESWLMSTDGSYIRALGSQLDGSYARAPSISWDSQQIVYVYGSERILYLEDIKSGKTTQLTQAEMGQAWNPWFLPGDEELFVMMTPYRQVMTFFKFHIASRKMELIWKTDEAIVGAIQSRLENTIALMSIPSDGKSWKVWSLKPSDSHPKLLARQDRTANSFSLQLSFDGAWLLYRCDSNPIRLASMDGSTESSLHQHLGYQSVSFATFYTQDPFPPVLHGKKEDSISNLLQWDQEFKGSLPLASYQLFRKDFSSDASWEILSHLPSYSSQYIDQGLANSQHTYSYKIRALDLEGNTSFWSNEVLIDRTPPLLEITSPLPKKWLLTQTQQIVGKVSDSESGIKSLKCNDRDLMFTDEGIFVLSIPDFEGKNAFHFVVTDHAGNYTEISHELWIDTQTPKISIKFPQDGQETKTGFIDITGNGFDATSGLAGIRINGSIVSFNSDGYFSYRTEIKKGMNSFIVEAFDHAGNSSQLELNVLGLLPVSIQCWIGKKDITINGQTSKIDAAPYIHASSGRTLVPVRFMVEPIDSTIDFDPSTQIITIKRYRTIIICQIDQATAIVNGIEKPIDTEDQTLSPLIKENRTYLPLRFVAENLGFLVKWNANKQQIDLYFPSF
jgi:hypothetical protein